MDAVAVETERPGGPADGSLDSRHRLRRRRDHRTLVVCDVAALALAFVSVEILSSEQTLAADGGELRGLREVLLFVVTLPVWLMIAHAYGLYRSAFDVRSYSIADELVRVLHLATLGTWVVFAGVTVSGVAHPALRRVTAFWLLQIAFVLLFRTVRRALRARSKTDAQRVLVVGAGEVGQLVARRLVAGSDDRVRVVAFVDPEPLRRSSDISRIDLSTSMESVLRLVEEHDVNRVVVAFSSEPDSRLTSIVRELEWRGIQVDIVPRLFEVVGPRAQVHISRGLPLVTVASSGLSRTELAVKRAFDLVVSALLVVALSPLLAVVALAVAFTSRGPIFFRQDRVGRGGRCFRIFKFRTMSRDAEVGRAALAHRNKHVGDGDTRMMKVHDDPRVTRIGRLLRRTSIDELPQLFNVLLGDMSLVGPRPLVLEEAAHVSDWATSRLVVKPGITGLWQVEGRDDLPFGDMVRLDYHYVVGWSLWHDLLILVRTIPAVIASASSDR